MEIRPTTEEPDEKRTLKEAMLPVRLQEWRAKLRVKAKQEKRFRFYSLYSLVSHPVTLAAAWAQVRANDGAPGVDGESIEQVEREGASAFLAQIGKELKEKSYVTGAVRRVYIRKENGKERPLGIPNLRDRVVQTAVLLILEPIFEVDFPGLPGFLRVPTRTERPRSAGENPGRTEAGQDRGLRRGLGRLLR